MDEVSGGQAGQDESGVSYLTVWAKNGFTCREVIVRKTYKNFADISGQSFAKISGQSFAEISEQSFAEIKVDVSSVFGKFSGPNFIFRQS
nr:hypothetical protein BgiMline_025124 [Biomphalaria glabrata]